MRACLLVLRTPLSLLAASVFPSVPIRLSLSHFTSLGPLLSPLSISFSAQTYSGRGALILCDIFVCVHHSVRAPRRWWKLMCTHMHAHPCTCRGVLPIALAINTFSPTSCFSLEEFSSGNIQRAEWFSPTHSPGLSSPPLQIEVTSATVWFRNNTVWLMQSYYSFEFCLFRFY